MYEWYTYDTPYGICHPLISSLSLMLSEATRAKLQRARSRPAAEQHSAVRACTAAPVHAFGDRHLGCLQVLASADSASVNIWACVTFGIRFPPDICPRGWLQAHLVVHFLVFKELRTVLHSVAEPLCFPTRKVEASSLTSSQVFNVYELFDESYSDQLRGYLTVVLISISLVGTDVEHPSCTFSDICMSHLGCLSRPAHSWIGSCLFFLT